MSLTIRPLHRLSELPIRLRDQRGQAVVEFAIVLPILLLLVLGIIYFGRYENDSSQATSLAELGARDAAINYAFNSSATNSKLANFIQNQSTGELQGTSDVSAPGITIECYANSSNGAAATPSTCPSTLSTSSSYSVSVCVRTTVQFPFLGHGATLAQKATMRIEQAQSTVSSSSAGDGLGGTNNANSTPTTANPTIQLSDSGSPASSC